MLKNESIRIRHILDAVNKIILFTEGKSRSALDENEELSLALIRLIEVIGEAAKKIPDAIQVKYPDVEWKAMIRTRDKLIHGYDDVDMDIVWVIVSQDIPVLKTKIEHIIHQEGF